MTYVMATVPKKYVNEGRIWLNYFRSIDCHKWIIALEHGSTTGLAHWQLRWKMRGLDNGTSKTNYFNAFKAKFPQAHIEFTENWCDYERKEGNFVCSDDNAEILRIRFSPLLRSQREILEMARSQGDRQIDVYLDKRGNHGKSFLSIHLWEQGKALLVPRYCGTAREISNFICSSYAGQEYIIIDIPRSARIKPELYEAIEEIKDGVVSDPRYSGKTRNVRGAKLLIFTNTPLDEKKLSHDRWRLHGMVKCGDALS